jgi:hypothetical protein
MRLPQPQEDCWIVSIELQGRAWLIKSMQAYRSSIWRYSSTEAWPPPKRPAEGTAASVAQVSMSPDQQDEFEPLVQNYLRDATFWCLLSPVR